MLAPRTRCLFRRFAAVTARSAGEEADLVGASGCHGPADGRMGERGIPTGAIRLWREKEGWRVRWDQAPAMNAEYTRNEQRGGRKTSMRLVRIDHWPSSQD